MVSKWLRCYRLEGEQGLLDRSLAPHRSPHRTAELRVAAIAVPAIAVLPRIDTPFLFPSPTGLLLNLDNWRAREWMPALDAAGIDHGTIYTLRHSDHKLACRGPHCL